MTRPTGNPPGRPPRPLRVDGGPALTWRQWRGVVAEITTADIYAARPWRASLGAVAEAARVSRPAVVKWRRMQAYRDGLLLLLVRRISRRVAWELAREDEPPPPPAVAINKRQRNALIATRVLRDWAGPVESPFDGEAYDTPAAYAEHLAGRDAIHVEDLRAWWRDCENWRRGGR